MSENKHIVYVGYNGFPIGWAQVIRQKLIAKGLIGCGCKVTIINRYGAHGPDKKEAVFKSGVVEGINYIYASGDPFRRKSFLKRNLLKCKGFFNEIKIIRNYKRNNELDAIIITTNEFYNVVFYSLLSFFCKVPSVIDNVEHWTSMTHRKKFGEGIDNYLYDNYSFKYVSKVLGISNFLIDIVREKSPQKPIIKVPAIVDFSKVNADQKNGSEFFLFCGSAAYYDIIIFVIDAFDQVENTAYCLYLVVASTGSPAENMEKIKERIKLSTKNKYIKLITNLEHKRVLELYTMSNALLIPLRNTPQDIARFPHKIGEYCAAGKVIISTNIGEIKNYFSDKCNALLADEYDAKQFAEKMNFVINNAAFSEELGRKSYETGKENFDHLILGREIYNFIFSD